ncbi:3D domain-containing protein [Oceanobacillus halophilus]|uniref:LysM peptidoglycan-binding domain-containing protein n=1 Tax=Oceanobacillus halophilus TaxID=930130 RepID=A0A495A1V3_9BACI|nr:3D domain-containing protein [Oceanobacillus halophilus]RKQ33421.1 LysM peptidoglycan-binding domain-containing protein [Oceanobacillus halophilus]
MRKLVAALATGIIIATTAVTTVSAEEYEVQSGDNLWNIAEENNTTVDELIDINELKDTVIHPKEVLLLNEVHKVKRGDSLISVANQYNVTVDELKKWNNIESDIIIIGQELEIKSVTTDKEENNEESSSEEKAETKNENKEVKTTSSNEEPEGKKMTVKSTAYTASCDGCSGVTYTGVDLNKNPDAKVIAVDPKVIPLGSEVYVEGYGYATAADIGSAIKGKRIDVFIPELSDAKDWGTRDLEITILD